VLFPPCDEVKPERDASDHATELFLTDRLRLEVKVSGGTEIGSWVGASQFDARSIFDLVGRGPFGTGALGTFLSDIFDNEAARFAYNGEVLADAGKLLQYSYQVPREASHYQVKAGLDWQVVAFAGEAGIDPNTLDLRQLTVRGHDLPRATEACEVNTRVDYARTRIGATDFLLPLRSQLHIVTISTQEDDITTEYSGCREYQSESKIRFGDAAEASEERAALPTPPVKVPAGLALDLALAQPIDTDTAATGDPIEMQVRSAVRAKGRAPC